MLLAYLENQHRNSGKLFFFPKFERPKVNKLIKLSDITGVHISIFCVSINLLTTISISQ